MKNTEITQRDKNMGLVELSQLPVEFQNWAFEKKISGGDLAPLRALSEFNKIEIPLKRLAFLRPSKSDGVAALELAVDLILMGREVDSHFMNSKTFSQLYKELKAKRFPLATQQSESTELLLKKLPWPKKMTAVATRLGDQAGIQVKFFIRTSDELKKQIEGLTAVWQELEKSQINKL